MTSISRASALCFRLFREESEDMQFLYASLAVFAVLALGESEGLVESATTWLIVLGAFPGF